jgi:molybdenum cofactor biosynthesis enzyme MoaA
MNALLHRKLDLGIATTDVVMLGHCLVDGQVWSFLRSREREIAILARTIDPEVKAFRTGKCLAFEYRAFPEQDPSGREAALLERVAALMVKQEETLARAIEVPEEGDRRFPLPRLVGTGTADGMSEFRLAVAGHPSQVVLAVGDRGRNPLELFRWSARVDWGGTEPADEPRWLVQRYFLTVVAKFLAGKAGARGEGRDARHAAASRFVYFDLKRPHVNRSALRSLAVAAGEALVLSMEVPSPCANQCVFCAPADRMATEEKIPEAVMLAEADRVLGPLEAKLQAAGRVDVVLTGRDALSSGGILPLLAKIRALRKVEQITIISPGTKLTQREFVLELKKASVSGVVLTILGPDGLSHDLVAGREGAFEDLLESIRNLDAAGLRWELNTVVVQHNVEKLPRTLSRATLLGSKVRLYAYVSEPFVPMAQALSCAVRHSELAAILEANRTVALESLSTIHYVPLCLLPEWARPLSGHSSQSFPDAPPEPPPPCQECPAHRTRCGSIGTRYLELFGYDELKSMPR